MQANLKAVTAAGLQKCREEGIQCDPVEVAYIACLLEEQQAWNTRTSAGDADAAAQPDSPADAPRQQPQSLRLCTASKLPEPALTAMAECLRQEVAWPADPAAAATARLQVALERSFKQQQDTVDAEQSQQKGMADRLASAVAFKKVNLQAAGLPLYQSVFSQVVDYVSAAVGLVPKTSSDPEARAQLSAAVESVLPLSSLAYFLTLPAQERKQQLESVAAISCGICLFNSHTGNAPAPLALAADTQLLQAQRLLADIHAAAGQAEAALHHYNNTQPQHAHTSTPPALAAVAAAYLGHGQGSVSQHNVDDDDNNTAAGRSSAGGAGVQLGPALFCCQAAVTLRALCVDLEAGISYCRQLHDELLSVLTQAAQLSGGLAGAAVLKEAVFPLFESGGHLYHVLKGELRLLLVRGRLWEATCQALAAAGQQPGVPCVLGFSPRHRLNDAGTSPSSTSFPGNTVDSSSGAAAVIDAASLPTDMEFVPPAAALTMDDAAAGGRMAEDMGAGKAPDEPRVLALCGVCPVSVAGSVAAGAAAAGVAAEGPDGAQQDRLLVGQMARPQCGMIRYAGKLYGFSSPAALAAFVGRPESILDAVRQVAHSTPVLLHMLGLSHPSDTAAAPRTRSPSSPASGHASTFSHQTRSSSSSSSSVLVESPAASSTAGYRGSSAGARRRSGGGSSAGSASQWRMPSLRGLLELLEAPLKVEAGTQTATHLMESLIDVNYEWNEWALRRRIIALANLRHKSTHSAQTVLSHFRREGSSQTWLPKQAAVQTKVNRGSSVPKKLCYVTGLRGGPDAKMKVVALELDVHGQGANVRAGHI